MSDKFDLKKDCAVRWDQIELFDPKTGLPNGDLDWGKELCKNYILGQTEARAYDFTGNLDKILRNIDNQNSLLNLYMYMGRSIAKGFGIKQLANYRKFKNANA